MNCKSLLTGIAAAFSLLAVSCNNSKKNSVLVPKDAAIVVHINSESLSSKLSWEEIKTTNWFSLIQKDATDSLAQKILKNPEVSGIDAKSDLVFFMQRQGRGGYMALEGSIKNEAAFEAFNKGLNPLGKIVEKGDFSYLELKDNSILSWNDSKFVYVSDAPQFGETENMFTDTSAYEDNSFPADSLKKFGTEILSLKGKENLSADDRFADMLKTAGDVHIWMNSEKFYGGFTGGFLSLMKLNVLLEGNISASTLNFENGKVVCSSKQFYGKEMTQLLDKHKFKPVSKELINRIPSQNVIAAFAMNFPPEGIRELFKITGIDGMANGFMGKMGYSVDEFIKANGGDILLTISDLQLKKEQNTLPTGGTPYTNTPAGPSMNVLFAVSVNNKEAFNKLVGITKATSGAFAAGLPDVTYNIQNNWFAIGNSAEQVNKFLAGGNNKQPFTDKIAGQPFVGFIDLQKLIAQFPLPQHIDESSRASYDATLKMWKDVTISGGDYKNGAMTSEVEINLQNSGTNSLKQLSQYFSLMAAPSKQTFTVPEQEVTVDTATALP